MCLLPAADWQGTCEPRPNTRLNSWVSGTDVHLLLRSLCPACPLPLLPIFNVSTCCKLSLSSHCHSEAPSVQCSGLLELCPLAAVFSQSEQLWLPTGDAHKIRPGNIPLQKWLKDTRFRVQATPSPCPLSTCSKQPQQRAAWACTVAGAGVWRRCSTEDRRKRTEQAQERNHVRASKQMCHGEEGVD